MKYILTEKQLYEVITDSLLNILQEEFNKDRYFDVLCKYPYASDFASAENSQHLKNDREDRMKMFADKVGEIGKGVYSFLVDTNNPKGYEIHTITEKGFIVIQNRRTKKIVTIFAGTLPQIYRYWVNLNAKIPRNDENFNLLIRYAKNNKGRELCEAKLGGMNYAGSGDEFYTREQDIQKELSNYDFNGKVVYCNCDDPSMSKFYKYFKSNFNELGLRGLYATYYSDSPKMYYFDGTNEKSKPIKSGMFQDNGAIMRRCDIIVTNPPFSNSLPSTLVTMARKYHKKLIMVAPYTLSTRNDMFDLIKRGRLNMGYTNINKFDRPDGTTGAAPTAWWTTIPVKKPEFSSGIQYDPSNYVKYDNFNAIDISDSRMIPDDYYGYMGISPTFLRKLNRDQFEIVGKLKPVINGKTGFMKYIIKRKRLI